MKRSKAHNVYLSRQTLDIMIALKTCAGNSTYLLPSRYDADAPMSRATFNRVTTRLLSWRRRKACPWNHSRFTTFAGQGRHCSTNWGSTGTGSRSAWLTRMAVRHAASTTRPSTKFSAAI